MRLGDIRQPKGANLRYLNESCLYPAYEVVHRGMQKVDPGKEKRQIERLVCASFGTPASSATRVDAMRRLLDIAGHPRRYAGSDHTTRDDA